MPTVLDQTEHFQIRTVAQLTGLSVHTIRAWEKRYEVVKPRRTDTKRRQYTREDIQRLTLLKALVDSGDNIGSIASLSVLQLEERLEQATEALLEVRRGSSLSASDCEVLLIGDQVSMLFESEAGRLPEFRVVRRFPTMEEARRVSAGKLTADLVVVDSPSLFLDTVTEVCQLVERFGARRGIIIYGFSQKETIEELDRVHLVTAIRGPISADEFKLAAFADLYLARTRSRRANPGRPLPTAGGDVPEPRYSREQLARLSKISSKIQCECPQHLANLILSLTAFEIYSLECENRNPVDAALHAYLHRSTASARSGMEEALQRVLEAENIEV